MSVWASDDENIVRLVQYGCVVLYESLTSANVGKHVYITRVLKI